ncbi:MAG: hypothetical protein ABS55_13675 [Lautropia sp. SCN 70-15]|nr:MAG: hypothetical protein ABS55_13675 [Lautropia sp. SCN 70-15]
MNVDQIHNANGPLLSVVVPTHNRARYATYAIHSVLAIRSEDLELVVHDTSEDTKLAEFARGIADPRLRYTHCREPLSMTENHNQAMALCRGRYVCLIGDDDSILPEALDAARWADRHGVSAIAPEVVANYAWPDFRSRAFGAGHAARLYMKPAFGSVARRRADDDLDRALGRAALGTDGLPKVYHGIVARSALERVRERAGAYFFGTSPDVSGAVGVAAVIDEYVWIDYPLTLPGASAGSNTGRSATGTHVGTVEDDPHTKRFRNLEWPEVLPRFVSVETVWAHAVHATLKAVAPERLGRYNMPRLYAMCLLKSFAYRGAILAAARRWAVGAGIGAGTLWMRVAVELASAALGSAWTLAKRVSRPSAAGGRLHRDGIETIADCAVPYEDLFTQARVGAPLAALLDTVATPARR